MFERARMRQASRIVRMDSKSIDNHALTTLEADDFIMPDTLEHKTAHRAIGFAI